jgi:excisionase family DNA binding protein
MMQTVKPPPTYLTARDVQDLIRVDRSTIYRMAESGRLPAIKVGRQWRFPADQVEAWLNGSNNGRHTPTAPSTAQDVADLFADLYDVMVVVTDIDGNPVTEVSNPNGYFSSISSEASALDRCIAEWKTLGGEYDFEPRLRPTHLGFLCTRAFIRRGNELVGMVISGGIAPDDWPPTPEGIEAIARESRVPAALVQQNIENIHRIDHDAQHRLLRAIPILARHLSAISSQQQQASDQSRSAT